MPTKTILQNLMTDCFFCSSYESFNFPVVCTFFWNDIIISCPFFMNINIFPEKMFHKCLRMVVRDGGARDWVLGGNAAMEIMSFFFENIEK